VRATEGLKSMAIADTNDVRTTGADALSERLLKIAVCYWLLGVGWGIYMGATENFQDIAVHAHMNLLGWVSLGLCGLIYAKAPHLAATRLAQAHFWLHNLGLPVLMAAVWLIHRGMPEIGGPFAGIASILVGVGVLSFAANLWLRGFPRPRQGSAAAASMHSISASLKP
jgi:hypothetical protein